MRIYNKKSDCFAFIYKNLLVLIAPFHKVDSNHITYILAGVLLMKLFHGTKATLDTFSIEYPGSGEAGDIRAVWFTDNFTGARNHNRRTKQQGPKRVYECELKPEAVVLKANIPLSQQPVIQKN